MLRNVYFDSYKNKIHLWETIKNERKYSVIDYVPYVYIENRDDTSLIKSIFGQGVQKKRFKTAKDYKEYCDNTINCDYVFENFVSPELQFLAERYYSINDDEMEMVPLKIQYTDIEVVSEKIDKNKLVNIRIKGSDSGSLYTYDDFIENFEIKKDLEHYNEKTKKWEEFNIECFNIKGGFPEAEIAEWPIVLISCYDTFDSKIYSFGIKEYTGDYSNEDWFEYIKCDNELDLLDKYTEFFKNNMPDIITGWNVILFDLTYIFNRVKNLYAELADDADNEIEKKEIIGFGDMLLRRFSPIKKINMWKKEVHGSQQTMIDIPGVTIIDYRDLYKQYSKDLLRIHLESYRLDVVAKSELGENKGKLEYKDEYGNLTDLYKLNYNLYVEYNAIDNIRVKEIQDKRKFIDIVQLLSLVAKFPMKYYESVTRVIEGIFLTYYRRNDLAAEHFYGGVKEPFAAAYVKDPQIGLHGWGADIDIKSSYPHGIITLNMGNDSYIGTIYKIFDSNSLLNATEEQIISLTAKREYPDFIYRNRKKEEIFVSSSINEENKEKNRISLETFNKLLKDQKICISPSGSMFKTEKQSCLASIQKTLFNRRVEYKDNMKKWGIKADKLRREYEKTKNEDLQAEIEKAQNEYDRFKSLQIVIKLIINSMYGALSVPYFRGYNLCIAEAITSTGRLAIKNGIKFVNIVMNDTKKSKELYNTINEMKKLKDKS